MHAPLERASGARSRMLWFFNGVRATTFGQTEESDEPQSQMLLQLLMNQVQISKQLAYIPVRLFTTAGSLRGFRVITHGY